MPASCRAPICRCYGHYLFCEDVPRHLYFFTRGTVRQYLEKTGFALEKEDNGRSIYKLAPYNWLAIMVRTKLLRKKYRYEDVPMTSKEFRYVNHLQGGLVKIGRASCRERV